MLVVSMADFSANPMQYIKNAKAMPFRLIDGNEEFLSKGSIKDYFYKKVEEQE